MLKLILNLLPLCESIVFPDKFPMSGFAVVHFAVLCGCETNAFSFFLSICPLSIPPCFPLFFLLESSNMELVLVRGLIKPSSPWAGVSQESHFEHFSEGEATMLYELGKQERFLQAVQRGTELMCRDCSLTLYTHNGNK